MTSLRPALSELTALSHAAARLCYLFASKGFAKAESSLTAIN